MNTMMTDERMRLERVTGPLSEEDISSVINLSDNAVRNLQAMKDAAALEARRRIRDDEAFNLTVARSLQAEEERIKSQVDSDLAFARSLR